MGALRERRRFAAITRSKLCTESYPLLASSQHVGATAAVTIIGWIVSGWIVSGWIVCILLAELSEFQIGCIVCGRIVWTRLICYKEQNLSFCTLYGMWGMIFIKKSQILEKNFHFILFHLIFICYYCSINLKRQSEHSGLCPDASSFKTQPSDSYHLEKNFSSFYSIWSASSFEAFSLHQNFVSSA